MTEPLRDARWNLRVAPRANETVRLAAAARHQNLSEFVIGAALEEADRVLAERFVFQLDDAAWQEFVELLDRPVQANPRLERLLSRPSVFVD